MKDIKPILIIITALVIIVLAISIIGTCQSKKTENVLIESELILQKNKLIDSLTTVHAHEYIQLEDSIQKGKRQCNSQSTGKRSLLGTSSNKTQSPSR